MATADSINRLKSTLLSSRIQQSNQPLFQVINQLIDALKDTTATVERASSGGGIGNTTIENITNLTQFINSPHIEENELNEPFIPSISLFPIMFEQYGTWTPTITGSGGSTGQVFSEQIGRYIKLGRLVFVYYRVALSTLGTITGAVQVNGLPFYSAPTGNALPFGAVQWNNLSTNWILIQNYVTASSNSLILSGATAATTGAVINLVQADLSNTTVLRGSLVYEMAT